MRAWEIQGGFGLDHLQLAERPDPQPGPGQVKLRVRAVSLNYRDLLTVQGLYNPRQKLPLIPCSDGVGEVVAVGEGVTRAKPGDRVCGIFAQRWLAGEPSRDKLRSTLGGPFDGLLAELKKLQDNVPPFPNEIAFARIEKELGWAASIGMNTMRVFLHDLAYSQDPEGFKKAFIMSEILKPKF